MNNRIEINEAEYKGFNNTERTPHEYLDFLYERTTDGLLIIPRWDDDVKSEENISVYYDCLEMNWTEADVLTLYSEYEAVAREINDLSEIYADYEASQIYEDAELLKKWRKYFSEASLVKDDSKFANYALTSLLRVLVVTTMGAPEIIINNERRGLVEAMAINRFATSCETA